MRSLSPKAALSTIRTGSSDSCTECLPATGDSILRKRAWPNPEACVDLPSVLSLTKLTLHGRVSGRKRQSTEGSAEGCFSGGTASDGRWFEECPFYTVDVVSRIAVPLCRLRICLSRTGCKYLGEW